MVASDTFYHHGVLGVQILAIQNFEAPIIHSNTDFRLRVHTNFLNVLLFELLLTDLLDNFGHVVKEEDFCGCYKDDIILHVFLALTRANAMPIIEHHITDIDIFVVVKAVAVEALYQDLLMIVPEGESIASIDDANP